MSRSKKSGEKFLDESTTAKKGTRGFKQSLLDWPAQSYSVKVRLTLCQPSDATKISSDRA
jgi:hypothetical protein